MILFSHSIKQDFFVFPAIIFHAVVEKPGPEAFLTDTPENLYARNEVRNIPFIASQSADEAVVLTLRKKARDLMSEV